ncbi:MAG TPA: prolyl oligopeptidase family serine peptidase [Thermoanaerobaculia bacterium]|nr:prolyl oligopeptidase family serine peptidase [Thermoanaerobaculia bacterium]
MDSRLSLRPLRPVLALLAGLALAAPAAAAPADDSTAPAYRQPSDSLVALVDAPRTPAVRVSPDGEWLLLLESPSLPGIEEVAARELRLAGMRIDPAVSGPSRDFPLSDLSLVRVADGEERSVSGLPAAPKLANVSWSPDGSRFAFTHRTADRIELWVGDVADGRARRVTERALHLAAREAPVWLASGEALVAALVPADRGAEPPPPAVPPGPVIRESRGRTAPARTYQDLLENEYDARLFEHHFTSQLAVVGLDGTVSAIGDPGLLWDFSPAPDGRHLLVETLHRPFSYLVPASRFPRRVEVWTTAGQRVAGLVDLPLQEEVPTTFGSVPTGPRGHHWRSDAPATVVWVEALDGGDAGREADERDRVVQLAAPFSGEPAPLVTLALRFGGIEWASGDLAIASEWWWRTRTQRAWRLRPDRSGAAPELLVDVNWEDRYRHPGDPVTTTTPSGHRVLLTAGGGESIFLIGDGASEEGDRPFLDRWDLSTKEKARLFRSEAPYYERPVEVLDPAAGVVLTRRESVDEPPNYFLRRLEGAADAAASPFRLTDFPHPTPQLAAIGKELVRYSRADGVELTATLYTPAGWTREDGPLPTLLWAYPEEFKDADFAGQVRDSPYRFDRLWWGSPLLWLAEGYAVLDDPAMPIVGEGEAEPNDRYVEQLVASAEAAVDELVRRGVSERGRIGVGGHSYGAFMVGNLLAHSDLFAAGIARSGAYNRTLTPFGFQSEERTFWEAPEVYFAMSPFMHADRVEEPILLIHGEADNNSGTFPMQSERFYNALQGHGATVRLVMLPHESHGYLARESVLHMLWETERWLDEFVAPERADEPPAVATPDDLTTKGDER